MGTTATTQRNMIMKQEKTTNIRICLENTLGMLRLACQTAGDGALLWDKTHLE